jgi:hypothetical protein
MAIQRDDSHSEADSYERTTAFLSDFNAKAAFQTHYHRQLSQRPPMQDLPSGTLRRRSAFSQHGSANNGTDAATTSLLNSLRPRTSLVFHEQHQNQDRPSQSMMSPCFLGAVLCEESRNAGGRGIDPLPFSVRPSATHQAALARARDRDHQQNVAPTVVRSAADAPSLKPTRRSRDAPCSSIRCSSGNSSSAGERRVSAEDITAKSQSEDIKSSPYTRTRRHSIDCYRSSVASSNDNFASIDQPNQVEKSLLSRSMYELGR